MMDIALWFPSLKGADTENIDPRIWVYLCASALLAVSSLIGLVIYRLYLSPLAKFPGPRLAALTGFYETYYDMVQDGQFTWQIERLHQKYGPIVRIKPWELHVQDPDYYNTLYAGPTRKRNKDSWFSFLGWPQSIFSTEGHALHRVRRSVLGQFFTRRAILDLEPVIQANAQRLTRHFRNAANGYDILELHAAFMCFASDTLSQYAFGEHIGFHSLDQGGLDAVWKTKINSCFELVQLARHYPWICKIAHIFPWPAGIVCSYFDEVIKMETDVKKMVRKAIQERGMISNEKPKAIYPTILENEKVPESEKKFARLADDAIFLMIAGTDAPSQALAITMFYVLRHPEVHERVRAELCAAWGDASMAPGLTALEQLTYFTAVLKEGLRLSSIVTTRLPRIAPEETLQFHGWDIPRGTPVSMSTYFILRDPKIFPEPSRFLPERWLLEPEELRKLERYLVPFSKGTLGCLGPNMTWAWLYLVLGTLLRKFDMSLHDTTERNVEMVRDKFIGQTERGMNRVQVKVLGEYQ
ncbi:cytochrome P450 [Aspergillus steynii IBT 23096]|uniref:Cytochrome P450 n=1 Tax=Aspergillus steynii IBT 23096 TaxID=1392250 RepID=A0A2I2GM53_9EURO|nr:cytochrome P450 [Aspergillus steynii IBT 23096]PLB53957.1 cytochrome P450 [Aspergillus steynii IBT 23096]